MLNKIYKTFVLLGKIFAVLFSFLLIALIIMAVQLKNKEVSIPCVNQELAIEPSQEYLDFKIISTCELHYIEIKVDDSLNKEEMKVIALNLSFKIEKFQNIEVLIYNNNQSLFAKIIGQGEIIIV